MERIAIIGTAGRDKNLPMDIRLWLWMLEDAKQRVARGSHLVSGGAAWADHLAVALRLCGHVEHLTLHLPAPFGVRFNGPEKSSAFAANFYHYQFSKVIGESSLSQIMAVRDMEGVTITEEPAAPGFGGFFSRNKKVAECEWMLAYTFGTCGVPADGGTRDTWNKCRGHRSHIELPTLERME